jgi:hypothetical protein
MSLPVLKAFVLCEDVTNETGGEVQRDLKGAGLSEIDGGDSFPLKFTIWVFMQLSDHNKTGQVRLAIMRADSGRRYYFRPIAVRFKDALHPTMLCVRLFECEFPDAGINFIELSYDDIWVIDQRLEIA